MNGDNIQLETATMLKELGVEPIEVTSEKIKKLFARISQLEAENEGLRKQLAAVTPITENKKEDTFYIKLEATITKITSANSP